MYRNEIKEHGKLCRAMGEKMRAEIQQSLAASTARADTFWDNINQRKHYENDRAFGAGEHDKDRMFQREEAERQRQHEKQMIDMQHRQAMERMRATEEASRNQYLQSFFGNRFFGGQR